MRSIMTILLSFFMIGSLFAQAGNIFPDSLEEITVTGTVSIDSSNTNLMYYLDTDGDDAADYRLKFGPTWYAPDSSDAVRPEDGVVVKIYGVTYDPLSSSLLAIIVYEINDLFWRAPFLPVWDPSTPAGYRHEHQRRGYRGYAGGWLSDSLDLDTLAVEGTVMIDSSCFFRHYYLDTDADTLPDYYLNFGPHWYIPESGLERPAGGDFVAVEGIMVNDRLFVLLLNSEVWFELPAGDINFGGKWIHKNMHQNRFVHTPYDSLSGMMIRMGWSTDHGSQTDSMYCQMLRLFPQDVPNIEGKHIFAGFEIGLFTKMRKNLMTMADSNPEPIRLATKVQYRFHYEDNLFNNENDQSEIEVHVWDNAASDWDLVEDFVLNTEANLVSYETETVNNLVILTSPKIATNIPNSGLNVPKMIMLSQNYPNPFNPQTNIEFHLSNKSDVTLNVYNILGQNVFQYSKTQMEAGSHSVQFGGSSFASGLYFYELLVDDKSVGVKKMSLIR